MNEMIKGLGKKIKAKRTILGLTLDDLQKQTGISKSNLSKYENEKTIPNYLTLLKIAKALDIKLEVEIDFKFDGEKIKTI